MKRVILALALTVIVPAIAVAADAPTSDGFLETLENPDVKVILTKAKQDVSNWEQFCATGREGYKAHVVDVAGSLTRGRTVNSQSVAASAPKGVRYFTLVCAEKGLGN